MYNSTIKKKYHSCNISERLILSTNSMAVSFMGVQTVILKTETNAKMDGHL